MPYELNEVQLLRKKLGITQAELAQNAEVSQSLIAKVESGRLDPSYSKAKKIFSAIDMLSKHKSLKAGDVMQKSIISVKPGDGIKEAIRRMKSHQISQMPVIQEHNSVGLVSESSILDALMGSKGSRVTDVMVDAPPVISVGTAIDIVSSLLKFYPIVLVSDKGKLAGVITKSDIISKI